MTDSVDLAVIGAGAAGLMAAIQARRANPDRNVTLLDGARKLGAKILVSGGGRCNVTHHEVRDSDFAGATGPAIRKVLKQFKVSDTIAFFEDAGVTLKREDTGKLFPTTDRAQSVLDALLQCARRGAPRRGLRWRPYSDVNREPSFNALSSGPRPRRAG